jgi:hypothetical protein
MSFSDARNFIFWMPAVRQVKTNAYKLARFEKIIGQTTEQVGPHSMDPGIL